MKIAHIKSLYDRIGGIESLIQGIMPELLNMDGVEPFLYFVADTPHPEIERKLTAQGRVPMQVVDWRGLRRSPSAARQLMRHLRSDGIDLVHTHDMRANLLTAMSRPFHRLPWLCHMHGWLGDTHKGRYKLYEQIDRKLVARADHVLVGSQAALEEVRAAGAKSSSVAWNAVTIPKPTPADRAALGLPEASVVITMMGRLHYGKGQDLFLKALAALPAGLDWHGVITGVGEAEAELKDLAASLEVSERATFAGFVPDVQPWVDASDIVAVPSRKESLPLTCLEAMASARPVVVAATGDLPLVVKDGETGLVVPVEDAGALSAAFARLVEDAALRARLGEAARQSAVTHHGADTLARATVETARAVLERRR